MATILEVKNVSMSYGKLSALNNVSFSLEEGQTVGLLGPNGSGKTTLIKIINTLITDYKGEVRICGNPTGIESKKYVSYLPDCEYLRNDMRGRALVEMYGDFYSDFDKTKALEMIRGFKLSENSRISAMSKGMREKLQLALVLSRRAKLYVFDEPIAGVDPAARDFILQTIIKNYNENAAILLSTHIIGDVEPILDRALFIKDGEIVLDGMADQLRECGRSIDLLFREEFKCS